MAALQKKNKELAEHAQVLESEITTLGATLKQVPGETVGEAVVRMAARAESGDEARRENVSLRKEVTKLQRVVASAKSLLKDMLRFFSLAKHPKLSERARKFEELVGEQVRPTSGPKMGS